MATKEKLTDPAATKAAEIAARKANEDLEALDVSIEDFKEIPPYVAVASNPFDGYPIKPKIKIGSYEDPATKEQTDLMQSPTYIVAIEPTMHVFQDPSNRPLETRGDDGKLRIVRPVGAHSRVVMDPDEGDQNIDVVFDREMKLKGGGVMRIAIVKSHWARAQICFALDKEGKILVDRRYRLLDGDQKGRLRDTFQLIHNPAARTERLAMAIEAPEGDKEAEQVLQNMAATETEAGQA